jgi:hypothetical protein
MKKVGFTKEAIGFWLSWYHEEKKRLFGPQVESRPNENWVYTDEEMQEKVRRGEAVIVGQDKAVIVGQEDK